MTNPPRLQLNADWGHFHLLELLSSGPTTEVYLARSEGSERPLALKIFHPELVGDPLLGPLIRREIQLAMKLDHPSVIRPQTIGSHDERLFLAMEHVDGITCAELLERLDRCPQVELAVGITLDLLAGLGHAHELGLVHGALAPDSLLLTRDGEVKLTGFRGVISTPEELSWAAERDEGRPGLFLPPERARGAAADVRGDVYCAAAVLCQLLAGDGADLRRKILSGDLVLPGQQASSTLNDAVLQALTADPSARFASTAAFSLALGQASGGRLASGVHDDLGRLVRSAEAGGPAGAPDQGAEVISPEGQAPLQAVATSPTSVVSETAIHRMAGDHERAQAQAQEQDPRPAGPLQDVPTIPTHVISETAVHRMAAGDAAPPPAGQELNSSTGVISETAVQRITDGQPAAIDPDQALPVLTEALAGTGAISETKLRRLSMAAAGELSDAPSPAGPTPPASDLHTAATEPKRARPLDAATDTGAGTATGPGTELVPVSPAPRWLLVLGLAAVIGLGGGLAVARISSGTAAPAPAPRVLAPGGTVQTGPWRITLLEAKPYQKHLMLQLEVKRGRRPAPKSGSFFSLSRAAPVFWTHAASSSASPESIRLVFLRTPGGDREVLTFAPPGARPTRLRVALPDQ